MANDEHVALLEAGRGGLNLADENRKLFRDLAGRTSRENLSGAIHRDGRTLAANLGGAALSGTDRSEPSPSGGGPQRGNWAFRERTSGASLRSA